MHSLLRHYQTRSAPAHFSTPFVPASSKSAPLLTFLTSLKLLSIHPPKHSHALLPFPCMQIIHSLLYSLLPSISVARQSSVQAIRASLIILFQYNTVLLFRCFISFLLSSSSSHHRNIITFVNLLFFIFATCPMLSSEKPILPISSWQVAYSPRLFSTNIVVIPFIFYYKYYLNSQFVIKGV